MTPYEIVIFDFDGTICDTREAVLICMVEAVGRTGGPKPTRQAVERRIGEGLTLADTLHVLASDRPGQGSIDTDHLVALYRSLYSMVAPLHSSLYPGVIRTLKEVAQHCAGCAIVSNKGEEAILRTLDHFGINVFDLLIAERPGVKAKPDPAAFIDVIAPRFPTVLRSKFLMVGDTTADLAFARNAGISSCWASYGYGDPELCRKSTPNHTIASFDDLRAVLALTSLHEQPGRGE